MLTLLSLIGGIFAGVTVLGIDFGDHSVKVAGILPNEKDPFQIVLNELSERKTSNIVGFRNGRTVIGSAATKALLSPKPFSVISRIKSLLIGQNIDSDLVREHERLYGIALEGKDEKIHVPFGDVKMPVEHLVGCLLRRIKDQAEKSFRRTVSGIVFAVPMDWTQKQRQALLDAAEIAQVNVLGIVGDVAAAALSYTVLGYSATEVKRVLIFDGGYSGTQAVVALIDPAASVNGSTMKSTEILGYVHSTHLSAARVDECLQEVMEAKFGRAVPVGRARNKLAAEASRVKQILTANKEAPAFVDDLADGRDLSCLVSRDEFESKCADLRDLVVPIALEAMKQAKVDAVDLVIPIGGSSRVPFVLESLKGHFGAEKVVQALNGEECIAKGAAIYAAHLHPTLRVRPFHFKDLLPYPVTVSYQNRVEADFEPTKELVIYPENSPVDSSKSLAFKGIEETKISVAVGAERVWDARVWGMGDVLAKYSNVVLAKLKVWINLNVYGMAVLGETKAHIEYEDQKVNANEDVKENVDKNSTSTTSPVKKVELLSLPFELGKPVWSGLSEEEKKRCNKFIVDEEADIRRENQVIEASNTLESLVFQSQRLPEDPEFSKWFTEEELNSFAGVVEVVSEAMGGAQGNLEQLQQLIKQINDSKAVGLGRQLQRQAVRKASEELLRLTKEVDSWLESTRAISPDIRGPTDEDLDQLARTSRNCTNYASHEADFSGIPLNVNLSISDSDLAIKALSLRQEFTMLKLKKPPLKEKVNVDSNENVHNMKEEMKENMKEDEELLEHDNMKTDDSKKDDELKEEL